MKNIASFIFAALFAGGVFGATYYETVDGVTWTYSITDGEATIGREDRSAAISPVTRGDLTVPSTLGGCPVTTIGDYAFAQCHYITSVKIPEGVTTIGDYAFQRCQGISSLRIPEGVTSVRGKAFQGAWLKRIEVADTNPCYCAIDGVLYTKDIRTLVACPSTLTSTTIPDSVTEIGACAFYDSSLRSITIPGSVEKIGDSAFESCSNLTSVTIPGSVEKIGDSAFESCSNLTSVTISEGVEKIGDSAFESCSNLTSVTISEGVATIGKDAFRSCQSLSSLIIPDSVVEIGVDAIYGTKLYDNQPEGPVILGNGYLYKYKGECPSVVTIPEGVKTIGKSLFEKCTTLTEVKIPDGVTIIGVDAFSECTNLTSIEIPDSVTSIGQSAFYRCRSLKSITIPDGVTSIADYTFDGCTAMTSVSLPDTVTSIGDFSFAYCKVLASIVIPDSVTTIGKAAFYGCDSLTVVTIPNGVTTIGYSAFYHCDSLTSISIPESVKSIDDWAFGWCASLQSITIPGSVTSISDYMVNHCTSLTSVTISEGVASIGEYAFGDCWGLATVSIPSSMTSIGFKAFTKCDSLKEVHVTDLAKWCAIKIPVREGSVVSNPCYYAHHLYLNGEEINELVIPSGVTEILPQTFVGCSSLTSVMIPEGVTAIGDSAFEECSALTSVKIPGSVATIGWSAFYKCSSLTSITIPDGVTTIEDYAFDYCSSLKTITIPASVTKLGVWAIGESVLRGCNSLIDIVVSPENSHFMSQNGCLLSKDGLTLLKGINTEVIEIPNTVKVIDSYALSSCDLITSITIPESVTEIGEYAFSWTDLKTVYVCEGDAGRVKELMRGKGVNVDAVTFVELEPSVLPDGGPYTETVDGVTYRYWINNGQLTSMMADFTEISALSGQTLVIPTTLGGCPVTKIEVLTLDDCSAITSLIIPSSVTEIGNSAFARFSSLTSVTIPSSVTTIKPGAFAECSSLTTVTIPSSVTDFAGSAFGGCSSLASIEIAEGNQTYRSIEGVVYSKDGRVLVACPASKIAMTIPETVTTIGVSAFSDCRLLTSVTIPNGVETIGEWAFNGCSSLTSVTIPDSVTTIGQRAFQECSSLKSVMLSNNLRSLEDGVFVSCSSLETITIPASVGWIANGMFSGVFVGCSKLASIDVDEDNSRYRSIDGVLYSKDGRELIACPALKTELIIPATVEGICEYAFYGCESLRSVTIPEGVTEIKYSVFYGCRSLASVTIPSSVTTIRNAAFSGCSSLTSVTIPESVTTIANDAFSGCSSLISFDVSNDNPTYCSIDGVLYSKDKVTLVACPIARTSITIPDDVTTIGEYAFFRCCALASVTMPRTLTTIGMNAFSGCSALKSVAIPNGVTTIEGQAFYNCSSLTSVMIPSSVTTIGTFAFNDCEVLSTVYVDKGEVDRIKGLLHESEDFFNMGLGNPYVDTLTFVEINVDLPEATYSHDFNGGMTTPSSTLGGVIIPNRGDTFGSFTHVIREGEPNGAGAIPSTASGKNGQYGSTELVDDEADWTIAMVAKAANIANGTFWSVGSNCYINGQTGMALVLKDATHVSLVRWQKGGSGNETLLTAEVADATEAFHLYTVAYNHATEVYTLFVDATEAASFTGARTFTTNGYQIGAVHGGAASVGLAVANGFILDDFAVWKDFAAEEAHVKKIAAKYTPVIAVGSYAFDWPEGETTWRNDIGFTVGSATGITPCAGDTIRFATGETITFASGAVIPSGLELIIDSGTVKLASGTPSKVTVSAGATLDVAGTPDREFAIVLNGGTLTNSGSNIGVGKKQTSAIELIADSLINSEHDFGSVGGNWGRITCKLNGHTLTKRGAGTFVFANTSFVGGGTINVEKGIVELDKGYDFPSGSTLNITGSSEGVFSIAQTGTQSGTVNLSGNPTVRLKITSIPNFVKNATGWTGKLLIAANISGLTSIGANTALYGNASEIEIASGASCSGYFPSAARTSKLTINGTFTVNDGYSGENQAATVSELAGSGTIVDGIAANSKSATPIVRVEKYADWNGTIQEATTKKLMIEFLQPTLPGVEGDDDVEVTGDAETGFVVKPSAETTEVVVTIPEGVASEKVTIEVSTAVQSVKSNGAMIKVVNGAADITAFLDIPAAVDGVVNLGAAVVKPEIVKEVLDPEKGAVIALSAENPTLTTTETKPGLTYTLVEGTALDAMVDGDTKVGDGSAWTPDIKVKGGASGFYSIKVTK